MAVLHITIFYQTGDLAMLQGSLNIDTTYFLIVQRPVGQWKLRNGLHQVCGALGHHPLKSLLPVLEFPIPFTEMCCVNVSQKWPLFENCDRAGRHINVLFSARLEDQDSLRV